MAAPPGHGVSRETRSALRVSVLVAVVALLVAACSSGASHRAVVRRATPKPVRVIAPPTSLTSHGVVATAVVAENARPGTSAWIITNRGPGFIEGFADKNYATVGDPVDLFVSTDATTYTVTAYRMGWYQGLGAREIWASPPIQGSVQPHCPVDHATNMVSCTNWHSALTISVNSTFVPGDYLLKLVGNRRQQAYVPLTVWDPASTATYLIMNRSLVEQGWNAYGGYSYYQGTGSCILDEHGYPPCNRARVVSFDRPYDGDGASDFLGNEYPLVQYAEELGLDATYCTDVCISEQPKFLLQHRALLALDHDETWTNSERTGALLALRAGVNMAFFGAATLVRHARLEPSSFGRDRQEVDYRNSSEDPLDGQGAPLEVTGNTWDEPPTSWAASSFVGQIYSGYVEPHENNLPMVVYDPSSWVFHGLPVTKGTTIPNMINSDIEHIDPGQPMPRNIQVLAHSPISLSRAYTNQGSWDGLTYSDMTYYTDPASKAGVFDSGDNVWVSTLSPCSDPHAPCGAAFTRAVTANVFRLFGQGPAGVTQPSVPNWSGVTPKGS
ncbi:MAG TPA: N,N-dimethylformamidase beta subunit family domain-containing protein [Acidimicrobiia bacterium]